MTKQVIKTVITSVITSVCCNLAICATYEYVVGNAIDKINSDLDRIESNIDRIDDELSERISSLQEECNSCLNTLSNMADRLDVIEAVFASDPKWQKYLAESSSKNDSVSQREILPSESKNGELVVTVLHERDDVQTAQLYPTAELASNDPIKLVSNVKSVSFLLEGNVKEIYLIENGTFTERSIEFDSVADANVFEDLFPNYGKALYLVELESGEIYYFSITF